MKTTWKKTGSFKNHIVLLDKFELDPKSSVTIKRYVRSCVRHIIMQDSVSLTHQNTYQPQLTKLLCEAQPRNLVAEQP